jgi:coenzyme F420-0:L-glutamate ligase/coenzyme F420-1:gamma-L-glutamate ligase
MSIELIAVHGIGEIKAGDVLSEVIVNACDDLRDGDVLVVTQKIVEQESVRIVRRRGDLIISETAHGFVCANAGIDLSNVERGWAALLPVDSDRSARKIRDGIRARRSVSVGVIISDTFGRPWRDGLTDVAIGCAGVAAVVDLRGTEDSLGRELQVTKVCVADEIAGAAELVMGKADGVPVAIVRGVDPSWLREGSVHDEVIRSPADDLFR